MHVPFLVTKEQFDLPVIRFNVIEQSIKSNNFKHDTLNSVFHKISSENVEATVNFIRSAEEDDLGMAKTCARDYVIPVELTMGPLKSGHLSYLSQMKPDHGLQD